MRLHHRASGFITMIVVLILMLVIAISYAYLRVVRANG